MNQALSRSTSAEGPAPGVYRAEQARRTQRTYGRAPGVQMIPRDLLVAAGRTAERDDEGYADTVCAYEGNLYVRADDRWLCFEPRAGCLQGVTDGHVLHMLDKTVRGAK